LRQLQTNDALNAFYNSLIDTGGEVPDNKNNNASPKKTKMKNKEYEGELRKLQSKLVEMQEWIKADGARVVVVFEGRDAAGKAELSIASWSGLAQGYSGMWRCLHQQNVRRPNYMHNAT
jgi:polyphosphate kinase 2 (PPK2 family)